MGRPEFTLAELVGYDDVEARSHEVLASLVVHNMYDYLIKNSKVRKHGSWFLLDECANEGVYCSVCNKKVYKTDYANQKIKSKYCPNCGAIMDLNGE